MTLSLPVHAPERLSPALAGWLACHWCRLILEESRCSETFFSNDLRFTCARCDELIQHARPQSDVVIACLCLGPGRFKRRSDRRFGGAEWIVRMGEPAATLPHYQVVRFQVVVDVEFGEYRPSNMQVVVEYSRAVWRCDGDIGEVHPLS
jgi:hypothetical protein